MSYILFSRGNGKIRFSNRNKGSITIITYSDTVQRLAQRNINTLGVNQNTIDNISIPGGLAMLYSNVIPTFTYLSPGPS